MKFLVMKILIEPFFFSNQRTRGYEVEEQEDTK